MDSGYVGYLEMQKMYLSFSFGSPNGNLLDFQKPREQYTSLFSERIFLHKSGLSITVLEAIFNLFKFIFC